MKQYKILRSEVNYQTAVDRSIEIFDAEPGTPDFDELEVLLLLIKRVQPDMKCQNLLLNPKDDPFSLLHPY